MSPKEMPVRKIHNNRDLLRVLKYQELRSKNTENQALKDEREAISAIDDATLFQKKSAWSNYLTAHKNELKEDPDIMLIMFNGHVETALEAKQRPDTDIMLEKKAHYIIRNIVIALELIYTLGYDVPENTPLKICFEIEKSKSEERFKKYSDSPLLTTLAPASLTIKNFALKKLLFILKCQTRLALWDTVYTASDSIVKFEKFYSARAMKLGFPWKVNSDSLASLISKYAPYFLIEFCFYYTKLLYRTWLVHEKFKETSNQCHSKQKATDGLKFLINILKESKESIGTDFDFIKLSLKVQHAAITNNFFSMMDSNLSHIDFNLNQIFLDDNTQSAIKYSDQFWHAQKVLRDIQESVVISTSDLQAIRHDYNQLTDITEKCHIAKTTITHLQNEFSSYLTNDLTMQEALEITLLFNNDFCSNEEEKFKILIDLSNDLNTRIIEVIALDEQSENKSATTERQPVKASRKKNKNKNKNKNRHSSKTKKLEKASNDDADFEISSNVKNKNSSTLQAVQQQIGEAFNNNPNRHCFYSPQEKNEVATNQNTPERYYFYTGTPKEKSESEKTLDQKLQEITDMLRTENFSDANILFVELSLTRIKCNGVMQRIVEKWFAKNEKGEYIPNDRGGLGILERRQFWSVGKIFHNAFDRYKQAVETIKPNSKQFPDTETKLKADTLKEYKQMMGSYIEIYHAMEKRKENFIALVKENKIKTFSDEKQKARGNKINRQLMNQAKEIKNILSEIEKSDFSKKQDAFHPGLFGRHHGKQNPVNSDPDLVNGKSHT